MDSFELMFWIEGIRPDFLAGAGPAGLIPSQVVAEAEGRKIKVLLNYPRQLPDRRPPAIFYLKINNL
ncbi:hypothetical protein [Pseudoxanthomonas broegbernensis]|uniref:hypothetical protein n=1 Tax=Pseudoxanthomonas broegbernensis TaxID=83619 RepID=UPI00139143F0|nr:hypothetical protein [Pseudoxanthomonas broegbernensis]MBB6064974.1 hypothetical protein [Pseudoxanthomonas broegbernensis]